MSFQSEQSQFLSDLQLNFLFVQEFEMIDWLILGLWTVTALLPLKNHTHALILVSIVELCWFGYDVGIGQYAQSIPCFFYFLTAACKCIRQEE